MRSLIDFIVKTKHWLVFILLEAVSLVSLFSTTGYPRSVYFTTANGIVGATYDVISSITSYLNLQEENRKLEATNQQLRQQLLHMQETLDTIKGDTTQRMPSLPTRYNLVHAQVINSSLHKKHNLMTINKGEADGIRPEMGVVCSQGVVGVVYMTSQHYSIVIPLLNEKSKTSCRLRKSEFFGSLIWKQGYCNIAHLNNIPRHAKVQKNDIVETNGYSDIFPAGLPVGQVQQIDDSDSGTSYMIRVLLYVDFTTLREVSVITNFSSQERQSLETEASNYDDTNDNTYSETRNNKAKETDKSKDSQKNKTTNPST